MRFAGASGELFVGKAIGEVDKVFEIEILDLDDNLRDLNADEMCELGADLPVDSLERGRRREAAVEKVAIVVMSIEDGFVDGVAELRWQIEEAKRRNGRLGLLRLRCVAIAGSATLLGCLCGISAMTSSRNSAYEAYHLCLLVSVLHQRSDGAA